MNDSVDEIWGVSVFKLLTIVDAASLLASRSAQEEHQGEQEPKVDEYLNFDDSSWSSSPRVKHLLVDEALPNVMRLLWKLHFHLPPVIENWDVGEALDHTEVVCA